MIDVREIPHDERHPRIFARYDRLVPGEAFILVSNHDPEPSRRKGSGYKPVLARESPSD